MFLNWNIFVSYLFTYIFTCWHDISFHVQIFLWPNWVHEKNIFPRSLSLQSFPSCLCSPQLYHFFVSTLFPLLAMDFLSICTLVCYDVFFRSGYESLIHSTESSSVLTCLKRLKGWWPSIVTEVYRFLLRRSDNKLFSIVSFHNNKPLVFLFVVDVCFGFYHKAQPAQPLIWNGLLNFFGK